MAEETLNPLNDFPVVISLPLQWGDQDAFGHVNNTVPIRWFESARVAYLEQSVMHQMMHAGGLGPILASVTCNYRRQLHYPDRVSIGARISKIGRSSLIMEHVVYSEKLDAVAADGTSTVVVFDYEANRPTRVPDEIRKAFELLEGRTIGDGQS
ncbi:MAG: acyl-CoA thioesterase [Planctomycetaceae bacterium]|nr:acyl-CoA thioesterase [Planctomycetales bacterium]MCB9922438.1 acyl-CoA thioesterase [Planctomycetaceae bacterium]